MSVKREGVRSVGGGRMYQGVRQAPSARTEPTVPSLPFTAQQPRRAPQLLTTD